MTIHTLTTLLASRMFVGYEGLDPAAFTKGDKYIIYALENGTKGKYPISSARTQSEADWSVKCCNQLAGQQQSKTAYYWEFLENDSVP